MAKTDHKKRQIRIELSGFSALYADPTDTWRPAIGDFLIFFFLNQTKKIKKLSKNFRNNHALRYLHVY